MSAARRSLVVAATAVVAVAAGCGQWSDPVDSRVGTAGLPTTLQDLEAKRWILEGRGGPGATLVFDEDTVRGSAPCNTYRGAFDLDGDTGIDIRDLATTRQACSAAVLRAERRYLVALAAVDTVHVDDDNDRLTLSDGYGDSLRFRGIGRT
jgi:heat shock protein HslJ